VGLLPDAEDLVQAIEPVKSDQESQYHQRGQGDIQPFQSQPADEGIKRHYKEKVEPESRRVKITSRKMIGHAERYE
jgi:hypothetical protein